jgi:hypothetical protein
MNTKRGCGYCRDTECEDYAKGVFVLGDYDQKPFYCPRCRKTAHFELERTEYMNQEEVFKEVQVHYNFDSVCGCYREIAIVRDNAVVRPHNHLKFFSPLIKTEPRALKVAEAILASVQCQGVVSDDALRRSEDVLSFDDPLDKFLSDLKVLGERLTQRAERERAHQ